MVRLTAAMFSRQRSSCGLGLSEDIEESEFWELECETDGDKEEQ